MLSSIKPEFEKTVSMLCNVLVTSEAPRFLAKCCDWLNRGANQDERGFKVAAIRRAYGACVRFAEAERALTHEDPTVKREAKKVVRGVLHREFPEICRELRCLCGKIAKADRRIEYRNWKAEARVFELDDGFTLRELRSATYLQRAGQSLRNCVAAPDHAQRYIRKARKGKLEIWAVVQKQADPAFMFTVDPLTRNITEFSNKYETFFDNPRFGEEAVDEDFNAARLKRMREDASFSELEPAMALRILDILGISGDHIVAFARIGAFRVFRCGIPSTCPIEKDGWHYWIWILNNGSEIVIATKGPPGTGICWSRFSCDGEDDRRHPETQQDRSRPRLVSIASAFSEGPCNQLSVHDLMDLALSHPPLAEKLCEAARERQSAN